MGYFSPELFTFLRQLKRNNNREWFNKNKERYIEDVQQPVLDFVESVAPGLRKISKNFLADPRPSGGSMFRIYRDVRFAKDILRDATYRRVKASHRARRTQQAGRKLGSAGPPRRSAFLIHCSTTSLMVMKKCSLRLCGQRS